MLRKTKIQSIAENDDSVFVSFDIQKKKFRRELCNVRNKGKLSRITQGIQALKRGSRTI